MEETQLSNNLEHALWSGKQFINLSQILYEQTKMSFINSQMTNLGKFPLCSMEKMDPNHFHLF